MSSVALCGFSATARRTARRCAVTCTPWLRKMAARSVELVATTTRNLSQFWIVSRSRGGHLAGLRRGVRSGDPALPKGDRDGMRPVEGTELGEAGFEPRLDRGHRDVELVSDPDVGESQGCEPQDRRLAAAQRPA